MECYFIAILSIVLVNVLVISSMQIEPRVQIVFSTNENSDEKLAEDGAFYNPNPVGGPVSAKMYEIHPQLAYLGQFNEKFWYIERTSLTQAAARTNCTSMGMTFARTNQEELNFLFDVTLSTDLPWVAASVPMQLSSFIWDGTITEHPTTRFTTTTTLGLRLNRAANNLSTLAAQAANGGRFALCTMSRF